MKEGTFLSTFSLLSPLQFIIIWILSLMLRIRNFFLTGMGSYKVLTNRRQLKDTEKSKFMNGGEVTVLALLMVKVWK